MEICTEPKAISPAPILTEISASGPQILKSQGLANIKTPKTIQPKITPYLSSAPKGGVITKQLLPLEPRGKLSGSLSGVYALSVNLAQDSKRVGKLNRRNRVRV